MDGEMHCALLGLRQGRLLRRLHPGRRARRQKLHCSLLVDTVNNGINKEW